MPSTHPLNLAAVALRTTPLDWTGNLHNARLALTQARDAGARVVCLPELALSGAGCEDVFFSPFVADAALAALRELLPDTSGLTVAIGLPLSVQGQLFDAAALIHDGSLLGFAAKQALSRDRLCYEARWFTPWTPHSPCSIEIDGVVLPLGDPTFEVDGLKLALRVGCDDLFEIPVPNGIDLVLNVNARAFSFGEQARFEALLCARTEARPVAIASSNLLGNEAGTSIHAGGALVVHGGQVLARSPRFSFLPTALALAETSQSMACLPDPFASKEEEFPRAVALGLFDYLRKSRLRGFVLSLSGGADSASIAVLVMLMARFAIEELGSVGFTKALGLPRVDDDVDLDTALREVMPCLLTTAYQATRNSSQITRAAASAVASAVGSRHLELDIEPMVASYRAAIEGALGRSFDWQRDDLTLQNIQARTRVPGIWMIANAQNALLLTTSNRSEAAVGYATMDGDTCGGLAPIVGIDKAWLRHWLVWLEKGGPAGVRPIPELALINVQAPTAELRPTEASQTDERDLMPYLVLDEIERLAIHAHRSPVESFEALRRAHPDLAPAQLALWVTRFFRMFACSQWKRERGAPGFHLDDANLSPRSWCRFPILNGGFERELAELERRID
ncbi:MAG: NAD(+) synthase [Myxococcales bacterium]|jgi:NAD+ synthase (glutamine-hydrolysing)|nr:NAD(+) synthase [Myxococcales bacterium]